MNQRLVVLETLRTRDGVGLDVRAPTGPGAAPPGYYMLFVLDNAARRRSRAGCASAADAPAPGVLPDPTPLQRARRAPRPAAADRDRRRA